MCDNRYCTLRRYEQQCDEERIRKILKYTVLTTEVQRMWNLTSVPVTIEATGTILPFRKYLNYTSRQCDVKKLQKTSLLGTANILRKVLIEANRMFVTRDNITCTKQCHCTTVLWSTRPVEKSKCENILQNCSVILNTAGFCNICCNVVYFNARSVKPNFSSGPRRILFYFHLQCGIVSCWFAM